MNPITKKTLTEAIAILAKEAKISKADARKILIKYVKVVGA